MSDIEDIDEAAATPLPVSSPADGEPSSNHLSSTILSSAKASASSAQSTPVEGSKKRKASAQPEDIETTNSHASKKSKAAPKKKTRKVLKTPVIDRDIGKTYEACEEYDKMIVDWRDKGKSWTVIRAEWERLTGDKIGKSTLPNRYNRLKTNFTVIKDVDQAVLILAKQEVENAFIKERWDIISQAMVNHGTQQYNSKALERQYKKLMSTSEGLKKRLEVEANNKPKADDDDDDFEG